MGVVIYQKIAEEKRISLAKKLRATNEVNREAPSKSTSVNLTPNSVGIASSPAINHPKYKTKIDSTSQIKIDWDYCQNCGIGGRCFNVA